MSFSITNGQMMKDDIAWAKNVAQFAKERGKTDIAGQIEKLIEGYSRRKITITLIGLNKRGKSTLCNALLGRKDDTLAPVDWKPATGVVSMFQKASGSDHAVVYLADGSKKDIPCRQIREYVLEDRNPDNEKNVDRVEVSGSFDLDDDVILQDLPGDNSLCAYHSQVIYRYLPEADIVLFLSSSTDPITAPELELLRKVADCERRKIFFVINKADACEDEEELEEAQEHDQRVLQKAGIECEGRLFSISAKQMMENGIDNYDFKDMANEIKKYLNDNKFRLLHVSFRDSVRQAVSELKNQFALQINTGNMSLAELQNNVDRISEERDRYKHVLEHSIDEFQNNWNQMLDEFEKQLPELEEQTRKQVKAYISNIPMMTLDQKHVNMIPAEITRIMEQVFQTQLIALQGKVKANLERLGKDVKSVEEYLSMHAMGMTYNGKFDIHAGSLISGGACIGIGAMLINIVSYPAKAVGWLCVGKALAAVGTTALSPLLALATPLIWSGAIMLALPALSWVRDKKRSKDFIMQQADNEVRKAFVDIRTNKIELLRSQGNRLVTELDREFGRKMTQCDRQLTEELDRKKRLLGDSSSMQKAEEERKALDALLG